VKLVNVFPFVLFFLYTIKDYWSSIIRKSDIIQPCEMSIWRLRVPRVGKDSLVVSLVKLISFHLCIKLV